MAYFRHMYFKAPPSLKEEYINGRRHYIIPTGEKVPSVTTVMSIVSEDGLQKWHNGLVKRFGSESAAEGYKSAVKERSTKNGTEFHEMIEEYLNNNPLYKYTNVVPKALFEQAKPELHKINNIWAQETQLYSRDLGLAGRVDCIAEYKGTPSIIDFKTANKRKREEWIEAYYLQETAYSLMLEEMTNHKVEQIVTIVSSEDGHIDTFVKNRNNYIDKLHEVIRTYRERNDIQKER